MWGNKLAVLSGLGIVLALSYPVRTLANDIVEINFNNQVSPQTAVENLAALADHLIPSLCNPGEPMLPCKVAVLPGRLTSGDYIEIRIIDADTLELPVLLPPRQSDLITSDTASPPVWIGFQENVYSTDIWYPRVQVLQFDHGRIHGHSATSVVWCPFQYNPVTSQLVVIRRAVIEINRDFQPSPGSQALDTVAALEDISELLLGRLRDAESRCPSLSPGTNGSPGWTWPVDPPFDIEYVVITGSDFVEALKPLVQWKARRGISAGLATVEAIGARYPAVDEAASIREYLKEAYGSGLQWVLLAGDETVVPIRYAYAGYKAAPADPYEFQICDMYFAELDGEWDADGDGIFGEYFGDHAELTTELFVGRVPFSDMTEAQAIVAKIIAYERGPADAAYLARALEVSADQMRDWADGTGQHQLVAAQMPSAWTVDQSTMIELPTGDNPVPIAPEGQALPSLLSSGYGWVNYFVHGRADGMVVRASGYSEWPKSYVWTFGNSGDGHGHLNELAPGPHPGIHLSIGCDHGGFDMDTPPFAPGTGESVAERLLFTPQGGAVAFVGQSRWGWVSSSYRLLEEFYRQVNDESTPNHIGVHQVLARSLLPQYRDLSFGNNLYGDPEMPVWKAIPREWSVLAPVTYEGGGTPWTIEVQDAIGPVTGAMVTVAIGDSVWNVGMTGENGSISNFLTLPAEAEAILTVSKSGYRVYEDTVPHAIVSDITGDGNETGGGSVAFANSPNPFNPSTTVRFSLRQPGKVSLTIYDILGRTIRKLIDGNLESGVHDVSFDGHDDRGRPLASGIYLARLSGVSQTKTLKMVLLR